MAQMPYEADLLTVLAVAMREVDTIEVGSAGAADPEPASDAVGAARPDPERIAKGRFILGLGMTHQAVTEMMWGIPWDKPLRRMREYLDGLQPLLAGKAAEAVGETVTTRGSMQIPGAPGARRLHRRARPADAAAGGQAHRGNADVDDRTQDARRAHRAGVA